MARGAHKRTAELGLTGLLLLVCTSWAAADVVTVEQVRPGFTAAEAGIEPGDRIVSIDPARSSSIHDILFAHRARPKTAMTVTVERDGEQREFDLAPGERGWKFALESTASGEVWAAHAEAESLGHERRWDEALQVLEDAMQLDASPAAAVARDALRARAMAETGRNDDAIALYDEVVQSAAQVDELWALRLHIPRAVAVHDSGDPVRAFGQLSSAVERVQQLAPGSLLEADLQAALTGQSWWIARFDVYQSSMKQAREIRERVDPDSLDVARALMLEGHWFWSQGDLSQARAAHGRARELIEELAPESPEMGQIWLNQGRVDMHAGQAGAALEKMRASLEVREKFESRWLDVAWGYNNVGNAVLHVGDFQGSRENHFKALEIRERLVPDSPQVAYSLLNIASTMVHQSDLEGAWQNATRALEIVERIPEAVGDSALCNFIIGQSLEYRGRYEEALAHHEKTLAMMATYFPGSAYAAQSHNVVADVLVNLGRIDEALPHLEEAIRIQSAINEHSDDMAIILNRRGIVARLQGDIDEAERLHRRALTTLEEHHPESLERALNLKLLGDVALLRDDLDSAEDFFERSIARLGAKRTSVGGQFARIRFGSQMADVHHDLVGVQLARDDVAAAFLTLERSRQRGLIELMAERQVNWRDKVPATLRSSIEALHVRRQSAAEALARTSARDERAKLHSDLKLIEAEGDMLLEKVRAEVPEYAGLVYPEAATLETMRASVEEGTVVIGFSVGDAESYIVAYVRTPAGETLEHAKIELSSDELVEKVTLLRGVVGQVGQTARWDAAAESLGKTLFGGLEKTLAQAERLLILPDGPLHLMPFALVSLEGETFAQRFPLVTVPSVTLYSQIRGREAPVSEQKLAWIGLGSPEYPPAAMGGTQVELTRGHELRALPGSREELMRIRGLFARSASQLFLGDEATERAFRDASPTASIVHLACHGILDDRFPLNSALALTIPDDPDEQAELGDGLLQAWEVFQDVQIEADLVVLSGCETGLGQIIGGEGLLGMSRAFLFGGARAVLVSLWPISDESAAPFMETFYSGLLAGHSKDEALRLAQVAFMQDERFSHPYHWAGYQLVGDEVTSAKLTARRDWSQPIAIALAAAMSLLAGWWVRSRKFA